MAGRTQVSAHSADELMRRWRDIGTAIVDAGFTSVQAHPMSWRGEVLGGLNLFGSEDIDPEMSTLAQAYADVATLAIVQSVAVSHEQVRARLHQALESRELLEQAKGVLAYTEDLSMDVAHLRLVELRTQWGVSLTQAAREILERRGATAGDATA